MTQSTCYNRDLTELPFPLRRVGTLANNYGVYKDSEDYIYYASPEAIKAGKEEWRWFELQGIVYIYADETF